MLGLYEGASLAAVELARGRKGVFEAFNNGYGEAEPLPYIGIRRFELEERLYSGTSFKIRLSRSSGLETRGDTRGTLLTSELLERVDEDRGRRLAFIVSRSSYRIINLQALFTLAVVPALVIERNGGYHQYLPNSDTLRVVVAFKEARAQRQPGRILGAASRR